MSGHDSQLGVDSGRPIVVSAPESLNLKSIYSFNHLQTGQRVHCNNRLDKRTDGHPSLEGAVVQSRCPEKGNRNRPPRGGRSE